jgi:hypothetical protein
MDCPWPVPRCSIVPAGVVFSLVVLADLSLVKCDDEVEWRIVMYEAGVAVRDFAANSGTAWLHTERMEKPGSRRAVATPLQQIAT